MNKLSKDKRDKLIIVCLATGGLLALLNIFVIGAEQDKIAENDRKISSVREKVDKAERMVKLMPRILSDLESNQKLLVAKEEGMAPLDKYRWFFRTISPFMN